MAKDFYGDLKLGILGGGQLGRMMIQEAINFNVNIHVLDPDKNAPCRLLCNKFECGSLSDFDTVYNFGKDLDLITIEIEKVNVDALEKLEQEGVQVFPQSRVIRLIQDKGMQKQFFKQNDIPTSAFQLISSKDNLQNTSIAYPFIQKLRKDGYDGKGVKRLNSPLDIPEAFAEPSIVEELVDFEKEIAVIVARNDKGDVKTFPMVEMEFNPVVNLVEFLISPSTYSEEIQQKAEEIAKKIACDLQIVGLLAVEMFLTKSGDILVNELAPRPHNSGHQTIEGNAVSQFAQHLRAIFNLPLGDTSTRQHAVMINLLGEDGFEGLAKYEGVEEILSIDGVYVHLYGKKYTKPFRKMGHICIINENRELAITNARKVQEIIKVKA
ncbi:5-(carboxyamino)imidazole ribonucleotide synthase [Sphingobacterium hungaricum]|uniref:N5-carboxyaminoimidazole ribonucleotide synthase n=1 Tax=Sphingobacterium hungaricum TaxID=2082723 RepID=A0A928UZ46_9SPHI|nr:5-(carboxyamino)imidazole ribonucleotide synthase [Sphingobacterium hungaricum]MBE8713239.1 5-(carboxyamino)imidazole ribonucleotide synthase [Sphingobacterium hungaricum]